MGAAAFRTALAAAVLAGACTSINATRASFDGTSWRVAAINGAAVPPTPMYQLSFADGRIGGRLGCNHVGGAYRVRANVMAVSDLASTLIGCPQPAATHESQAFAVLRMPMRVNWLSEGHVRLENIAGSIALKRMR